MELLSYITAYRDPSRIGPTSAQTARLAALKLSALTRGMRGTYRGVASTPIVHRSQMAALARVMLDFALVKRHSTPRGDAQGTSARLRADRYATRS
jgi:hypothetical protein